MKFERCRVRQNKETNLSTEDEVMNSIRRSLSASGQIMLSILIFSLHTPNIHSAAHLSWFFLCTRFFFRLSTCNVFLYIEVTAFPSLILIDQYFHTCSHPHIHAYIYIQIYNEKDIVRNKIMNINFFVVYSTGSFIQQYIILDFLQHAPAC